MGHDIFAFNRQELKALQEEYKNYDKCELPREYYVRRAETVVAYLRINASYKEAVVLFYHGLNAESFGGTSCGSGEEIIYTYQQIIESREKIITLASSEPMAVLESLYEQFFIKSEKRIRNIQYSGLKNPPKFNEQDILNACVYIISAFIDPILQNVDTKEFIIYPI